MSTHAPPQVTTKRASTAKTMPLLSPPLGRSAGAHSTQRRHHLTCGLNVAKLVNRQAMKVAESSTREWVTRSAAPLPSVQSEFVRGDAHTFKITLKGQEVIGVVKWRTTIILVTLSTRRGMLTMALRMNPSEKMNVMREITR